MACALPPLRQKYASLRLTGTICAKWRGGENKNEARRKKEEKKMNAHDRRNLMIHRLWTWIAVCVALVLCDRRHGR